MGIPIWTPFWHRPLRMSFRDATPGELARFGRGFSDDVLVREINGEIYPCRRSLFEAISTPEPVDDALRALLVDYARLWQDTDRLIVRCPPPNASVTAVTATANVGSAGAPTAGPLLPEG